MVADIIENIKLPFILPLKFLIQHICYPLFLTQSVKISLPNWILFIKLTVSYYNNDKIRDTTVYYTTCSFAENQWQATLLKTQPFFSSWIYLISGAWGSKSCTSVFFALQIGTQKTPFLNYLDQRHLVDTTVHLITFMLSLNKSQSS